MYVYTYARARMLYHLTILDYLESLDHLEILVFLEFLDNLESKAFSSTQGSTKRKPLEKIISSFQAVRIGRRLPTLPPLGSTIGVDGLNFSVRNGKRWNPGAIATINKIDISIHVYLRNLTHLLLYSHSLGNIPTNDFFTICYKHTKFRAISSARL